MKKCIQFYIGKALKEVNTNTTKYNHDIWPNRVFCNQITNNSKLNQYRVCMYVCVCVYIYTVNHKKRDILFLTITLANLNRFL